MKTYTKIILFTLLLLPFSSCDTVQQILEEGAGTALSSEEVGRGLKQALEFGINEGAQKLSQKDGYFKSAYKILLPPEARKVTAKLQNVPGFTQLENTIIEKVNRGAEDAAKKAAPIFKQAITQMTFRDAFDILMGNDDAATNYLKRATFNSLYQEFNPVIVESLDKFNARTIWGDAVNAYNKIPFNSEKVNNDLDDYVTRQALDGLFSMVQVKEADIRNNLRSRSTDLLRRVFARQDGN